MCIRDYRVIANMMSQRLFEDASTFQQYLAVDADLAVPVRNTSLFARVF